MNCAIEYFIRASPASVMKHNVVFFEEGQKKKEEKEKAKKECFTINWPVHIEWNELQLRINYMATHWSCPFPLFQIFFIFIRKRKKEKWEEKRNTFKCQFHLTHLAHCMRWRCLLFLSCSVFLYFEWMFRPLKLSLWNCDKRQPTKEQIKIFKWKYQICIHTRSI